MHHPFCCASTLSHQNSDLSSMPPPLPPVSRSRANPVVNGASTTAGGHNRPAQRAPSPAAARDAEVKIKDLVGNGVSGILHKWVNYGKGWRPRWFVLHDGVLSYYKIHGPHKIAINEDTEKGSKVIGDESIRQITRHRTGTSQVRRKPFGEIHLKVSSVRESRSDDRRFSIFTGTKRLHLRTESREDRVAWMEALQFVKDMFPRMSNSELMAPLDNVVVSTEKLRQRLLEEGVSEAAIQDSEGIMRSEFAALQNQLMLLKQKQWALMDTLRQLEVHVTLSRKHHGKRIRNSSSVSPAQDSSNSNQFQTT